MNSWNGPDERAGDSQLRHAIRKGNVRMVEQLLHYEVDLEKYDRYGHTLLMTNAIGGSVNVAKILIEYGAKINTYTPIFNESALTLACFNGRLEMVEYLIKTGAYKEHKTDENHTPLMEAILGDQLEVTRYLVHCGAMIHKPVGCSESPLTLVARGGNLELAKFLIDHDANIEERNDKGRTPLMEAARKGDARMVYFLYANGAKINAQSVKTFETSLVLACRGGFRNVVIFLIKKGADLAPGKLTPLMEAAKEGHINVVGDLLKCGAELRTIDTNGYSALNYACENGHTDVADLLLSKYRHEPWHHILLRSCMAGYYHTVKYLITKNVDINKAYRSVTPLSCACTKGHLAVVELLLANSANVFHKQRDNYTMVMKAAQGGHTRVVKLLLDHMRSVTCKVETHVFPPTIVEEEPVDESYASSQEQYKNLTANHFQINNSSSRDINNISGALFPRCLNTTGKSDSKNVDTLYGVNAQTEDGHHTALLMACSIGNKDLVKLLLDYGADIELKNKRGYTPLIIATSKHFDEIVEILLNYNANIEAQFEENRCTPLSAACRVGSYKVCELLLQAGANIEHIQINGYTPLSIAARYGFTDIIRLLIVNGAEINCQRRHVLPPLLLATAAEHIDSVKVLLEMGGDPDIQLLPNRTTALILALTLGNHELVTLLLGRGADVDHRNSNSETPLMEAARHGHVEVDRILIDNGADVCASTVRAVTSFMCALGNQCYKFIMYYLFYTSNDPSTFE